MNQLFVSCRTFGSSSRVHIIRTLNFKDFRFTCACHGEMIKVGEIWTPNFFLDQNLLVNEPTKTRTTE